MATILKPALAISARTAPAWSLRMVSGLRMLKVRSAGKAVSWKCFVGYSLVYGRCNTPLGSGGLNLSDDPTPTNNRHSERGWGAERKRLSLHGASRFELRNQLGSRTANS